jgi:ankyrin repeat protein
MPSIIPFMGARMRACWLIIVTAASAVFAYQSPAADVDARLLPSLAYIACLASPEQVPGNNPRMAKEALCAASRGICRDRPGSMDCETLLARFRVRELAADDAFVLFAAASIGYVANMTAALERGADPNATIAGQYGWTPLMIAAANGHEAAVRALLAVGGDPNRRNDLGRTALMFASSYGFIGVAKALLDGGADLNVVPTDETHWTALMAAACAGRAGVVELLLERGADAALTDAKGGTPLACARSNDHSDVVKILRARRPATAR